MLRLSLLFLMLTVFASAAAAGPFVGGGLSYDWKNELDVFKNRPSGLLLGGYEFAKSDQLGFEVSVQKAFDLNAGLDDWKGGGWQGRAFAKFRF